MTHTCISLDSILISCTEITPKQTNKKKRETDLSHSTLTSNSLVVFWNCLASPNLGRVLLVYGEQKNVSAVGFGSPAWLWELACGWKLFFTVLSASQAWYRLAAGQECSFCTHCLVESSQVHHFPLLLRKNTWEKAQNGGWVCFGSWSMTHKIWKLERTPREGCQWKMDGHEREEWGTEITSLYRCMKLSNNCKWRKVYTIRLRFQRNINICRIFKAS